MSRDDQPRLEDLEVAGDRVRLRPVRPADAAIAFPLLHGREPVLRWLVWKGPRDVDELARAYADWRVLSDAGANYRLAIEEAAGGGFAGTISLRFGGHPFVGDLGYWVAEDRQGRGLGTEAILLAAYVAVAHLRASALVADVFVGNHASARALEKVGFERADTVEAAPLERLEAGGAPVGIDRPKWSYALTRGGFRRAWPDFTPRRERVSLEP